MTRLAIIGAGFWARYQTAAWQSLDDVECVAICDLDRDKAEWLARERKIPTVYEDAEAMLRDQQPDLIDVITNVETHRHFVELAVRYNTPVICQKPMSVDLTSAQQLVEHCRAAGVPFFVHENWRWQYPIRQFKRALENSAVGQPFRAHIFYASNFPVFDNQPFLKELDQFILTDIGSHILDVARFLFGEAENLYCQTYRSRSDIKGEDVATVMMKMGGLTTVTCSMSYASLIEHNRFPETYILTECEYGSVELGPDFQLKVTTEEGTLSKRVVPPHYPWADPAYDIIHTSIVDCNASLLQALQTGQTAETSGADNLKTCQLYFGAYESAARGQVIQIKAGE